ncbi:MAG: TIGR03943 family protein [Acidimicrobiia bacterium]|nr:TIGR03943 family protein [Acidimicrobiia bacterium]
MTRLGRAALLLTLGVVGAVLVTFGGFGQFVQQRMRLPLLVAAVVLLLLGLYEAQGGIRTVRSPRDHDHSPHDHKAGNCKANTNKANTNKANNKAKSGTHDHGTHDHRVRSLGPRVGWLLVMPVVVLISVAPTALGAAASGRVAPVRPTRTNTEFAPLDASAGPIEMRVYDFLERATFDPKRSLDDVPVRLEGLVVNDPSAPDGFLLTRFVVSCCAADGSPAQVTVHGSPQQLADDTWVEVDLIWRPPAQPYSETPGPIVVEADASRVVVSEMPDDPYESPYS